MKKVILLRFLLLLSVLFISCDPNDNSNNSQSDNFSENFGNPAFRDFIGQVVDENNAAVANATVTIGTATKQTDVNGVFIFEDASVYEKFAYVKVTKAGFLDGSRALVPTTGKNNVKIMLLSANVTATVASGATSEITLPNGTKVTFDGGFETESGAAYSGTVSVIMHHLDPSDEQIWDKMPGMLMAENENKDAGVLETFGMMNVELRGSDSQKLQLTGTAEIEMPITASQQATAPATIPLWHFDEVGGYWKEEGFATKQGNKYVGEVSHFSWWNCDVFFPSVMLTVTVVDSDGNPVYNAGVQLNGGEGLGNSSPQYTDSNGQVSGLIPSNQTITATATAYNYCEESFVETILGGPFATDTVITIVIDAADFEFLTISGNLLGCDGAPVTNGYVHLIYTNQVQQFVHIDNGNFTFNYPSCNPPDLNMFTLEGYDYAFQQSTGVIAYTFTAPNTIIGNITACSSITEFISYQIDDNPVEYITENIIAGTTGAPMPGGIYISAAENQQVTMLSANYAIPGSYYTPDFAVSGNVIALNNSMTNDIVMQLTNFGAVGEYIDLIFNGTFTNSSGVHIVTGTVHVIRDN